MIKKLLLLGFSIIGTALFAAIQPEAKHSAQLRLIDSFLSNHHYKNALFDDEKSKEVLDKYIYYLDFGKYLFTQADIKRFRQYESALDNFTHKGQLTPVFDIYNTFSAKRSSQIAWVLQRLQQSFSEESTEELELDRDKVAWAADQEELEQRWEKMLLNAWITLRLAKQSDEKARTTLRKRYENMTKRVNQAKPDEVFQLFANALTSVYDPHTAYFSPRSSENFDINMSLSLEGIGAQLTIEEELITIKELIAGGPAQRSGQLAANDQILGVAQGEQGPMEDVVGWRLDEAVDLIRGKRGTTVRLQIQKALSNEIVEITLVRDKIKLEESAAKSEIKRIEYQGKIYRVGVIELPSFYIDFEAARKGEDNYRSTTRDVKRLITELKTKGIDGLMIDLRNNGGGSLAEAIDLTGLFFDAGPVVQVRRADGSVTIHADEDKETYYDGPLAVLINQQAASASEIFAAAIKDYGRGVVLGEPSFGKGTVQTILDLSRFLPSIKDKVGQIKMTIAMFYRVNGGSTQLKGVTPDIYIPDQKSYVSGGEREEKHALPWHQIDAVKHQQFSAVSPIIEQLRKEYANFSKNSELVKNVLAQRAWQKNQRDNTVVSLSLKKRQTQKDLLRDQSLVFQNQFRKHYGYPLLTASYLDKKDKEKTQKERDDDEKYQVDAILDIAVRVTADYIRLQQSQR